MKFLKYFFLLSILIATSFSTAQTVGKQLEFNSAWGVDYESNMVKNPSAAKNLNDTLKLGATLSRDNSSGNKIDGKASFLLDASALNDYLELDLYAPSDEQTSGNCGFKGLFKGDARLYRAQILDGSSNVLAQTVPLTNETGFREFRVWYPCGAAGTRKVRITQTEAGTAPAINVGKFYYGRMEPGSGTSPNEFSAFISSAAAPSVQTGISDWISSCAISDTSLFTCTLKSGLVTQGMNCEISVVSSSTTESSEAKIVSTSATSVVYRTGTSTTSSSFTKTALATSLSCTKTGSDYVQPAITPDQTDRPYTPYTPVLSTGALATGGNQKYWYMLDGPNMIMYFEYEPGANIGTAGSGNYFMNIPGGYSISSTISSVTGGSPNFGYVYFLKSTASGDARAAQLTSVSSTQLAIRILNPSTNTYEVWSSTTSPLNTANMRIGFIATIPIAGRENIRSTGSPILLGSVTSNAQSALKHEIAAISCAAASSIVYDTELVSSVANAVDNGTTRSCVVTLKSGFSVAPRCMAIQVSGTITVAPSAISILTGATTTSLTVMGPDSDFVFNLMCTGQR